MCQERESVLYLPIKESESLLFTSANAGNPHSAKKSRKSPPPRLLYSGLRSLLQHKSMGFVHPVYRTQAENCLITQIAGFWESAVWHVLHTEV